MECAAVCLGVVLGTRMGYTHLKCGLRVWGRSDALIERDTLGIALVVFLNE
jgi:hypothetical protein